MTLAWAFQTHADPLKSTPLDTHDWDAVETPVLFDAQFGGRTRKLLAQASRNGYFFLLDRNTGEHLLTTPFVMTDWAKGADNRGQPVPDPAKEPQTDGSFVAAADEAATNWMAPSFDPETKLFYVNAEEGFVLYYLALNAAKKAEGHQGGSATSLWSRARLVAIDLPDGQGSLLERGGRRRRTSRDTHHCGAAAVHGRCFGQLARA